MEPIPPDIRATMVPAETPADTGDNPDTAELLDGIEQGDADDRETITYWTDTVDARDLHKGKVDLHAPSGWDAPSLLLFLNNLTGNWVTPNGGRMDSRTGTCYCCTFERKLWREFQRVRITISPHWRAIRVRIARRWLPPGQVLKRRAVEAASPPGPGGAISHSSIARHEPWKPWDEEAMTARGSRGRPLKKPRLRRSRRYTGKFAMQHSSRYIKDGRFQLMHDPGEFSKPLRYLIETITQLGETFVPEDCDLVEALAGAIESGTHHEDEEGSETRFRNLPGRLSLTLVVPEVDDGRDRVRHDGNEYVVSSGSWLSPFAHSVLTENEVDGVILDTTFTVMRQHQTAILTSIVRNVGIPLAFSFGPGETIELYDEFDTVFREELGIDLTQYSLLSDQGSALKSIGKRRPRHLFCLRHVLKTLAAFKYGLPVGNLVRCRGQKEFALLCDVYARHFRLVLARGGQDWKELQACLKKVGLGFEGGRCGSATRRAGGKFQ